MNIYSSSARSGLDIEATKCYDVGEHLNTASPRTYYGAGAL